MSPSKEESAHADRARVSLSFAIESRCSTTRARTGSVTTLHGSFQTPAFMPVGTKGSVKGLLPTLVRQSGSEIILGNTYHLMLRPGSDRIARLGGLHSFMGWTGPILTDSGGYQAFSLAVSNSISDDGVVFRSEISGEQVNLTPEHAIEVQNELGADIIMALDDCPPSEQAATGGKIDYGRRLDEAEHRTVRWLERCMCAHGRAGEQSLFGIVQGGTDLKRRTRCAEQVCGFDLPGYAIGGVAVGEGPEEIARVVSHTAPLLPDAKPRYLMGVGYERDIVAAVQAGVDMFDCVLPTRNGRTVNAFTSSGQIRLNNAKYADDPDPIEEGCDCLACDPSRHGWETVEGRPISRAYLRHLYIAGEMLGPVLVSLHNVRHFQRLMVDIRRAIREDGWSDLARRWPVVDGEASTGTRAEQQGERVRTC